MNYLLMIYFKIRFGNINLQAITRLKGVLTPIFYLSIIQI
jgi:hypothetical protein